MQFAGRIETTDLEEWLMTTQNFPVIECDVAFLKESEGGRKSFPKGVLSGNQYRPHLVVGDISQRHVLVDENNHGLEEYLGIAFTTAPEIVEPGKIIRVTLTLMYFPYVNYEKLFPGATFTIREGGTVVGYGQVLTRNNVDS